MRWFDIPVTCWNCCPVWVGHYSVILDRTACLLSFGRLAQTLPSFSCLFARMSWLQIELMWIDLFYFFLSFLRIICCFASAFFPPPPFLSTRSRWCGQITEVVRRILTSQYSSSTPPNWACPTNSPSHSVTSLRPTPAGLDTSTHSQVM